MKTIETKAVVTEDGKLIVQVLTDISPGEHRVILIVEEQTVTLPVQPSNKPLQLNAYPWGNWSSEATFRREDI